MKSKEAQGPVSYKSDAVNDYVGFTFKLPQSCTSCGLEAWYAKSSNFGKWQANLDGTNVGSVQDGYHTSLTTADGVSLGSATVASGTHQIKFTVTSKNTSSFGYQAGPGSITIERP